MPSAVEQGLAQDSPAPAASRGKVSSNRNAAEPAAQQIRPLTTVERVVVEKMVVSRATEETVIPIAARERVISGVAVEVLVPDGSAVTPDERLPWDASLSGLFPPKGETWSQMLPKR